MTDVPNIPEDNWVDDMRWRMAAQRPLPEPEEERNALLTLAARAANKLMLNRQLYRYPWMDEISFELVELECAADRLRSYLDRGTK